MKDNLTRSLSRLEKQRRFLWKWRRVLMVCAAFVVFWTTYAMILPAITWERMLICSVQAHTHSDRCYTIENGERVLTCQLPEHTHEASCFDAPPATDVEYLCGLEEHSHSEDCYFSDGSLKCTMEEHKHTGECRMSESPEYLCGMIPHTHGEECIDEDNTLICTIPAHTHTDACRTEAIQASFRQHGSLEAHVASTTANWPCGMTAHTHTGLCYEGDELICGMEEHVHTIECLEARDVPMLLAETADPNAKFVIPPMITADEQANDWQVVSGRFTDAAKQGEIIVDADGNELRLRKNLVPTGVENEFYVYLSVEPVFYHQWVEIFKGSGMLVNSANNERQYNDVGFSNDQGIDAIKIALTGSVNAMQGHSSLLVPAEPPYLNNGRLGSFYTDQSGKEIYINTIELQRFDGDTNPIRITGTGLVFSFSQNSSGSFTIIYSAPNSNSCVKLSNIWWDGNGRGKPNAGGLLRFPHEAYDALLEANSQVFDHISQRSFPQSVTDPMGEHIEYLGLEYCSTGTSSVSFASNTLNWNLRSASVEPSQSKDDYEQINDDDAFSRKGAFQLVYKVRLKVTDDGFNSAAAQLGAKTGDTVYSTNGRTTVSYKTDKMSTTATPRTADFKVPEVRGVLYDISFWKMDQYARAVPGAEFTLKDASGKVLGTITTKDNVIYTFHDLPWGTYYLEEKAPDGYSVEDTAMVSTKTWEVRLCYTTDPALLIADTSKPIANMMYKGNGDPVFDQGALMIPNYKFTREFKMRKVDPNGLPLEGAKFELYLDQELTQRADASFQPSNADGFFTAPLFSLTEGTYYLVETAAPRGYILPRDPGVLTVNPGGSGFSLFWNGRNYNSEETIDGYHSTFTLELDNRPSVPLPETGGRGMRPITVAGIAVLVLTWSYYFMQCRKKAGDKSAE